jgi:hypothetical protein
MLGQASLAFGQQEPTKALILYDPLFWSEALKLDRDQLQRISDINHDYYQRLMTALQDGRNDPKKLQRIVAESLLLRSQSIWETFHPKQKRKWKKMWGNDIAEHTSYKVAAAYPPFQKFRI